MTEAEAERVWKSKFKALFPELNHFDELFQFLKDYEEGIAEERIAGAPSWSITSYTVIPSGASRSEKAFPLERS